MLIFDSSDVWVEKWGGLADFGGLVAATPLIFAAAGLVKVSYTFSLGGAKWEDIWLFVFREAQKTFSFTSFAL